MVAGLVPQDPSRDRSADIIDSYLNDVFALVIDQRNGVLPCFLGGG